VEELGERGAAPGEVAQVDYVGRIDGGEFPGGSGTDVDVEIGGGGFIPGFAEQLEEIRPGETRSITVTFPEGYGVPDVAGKTAVFEVTGKAVKRIEEPAMDEAFATRLGFENLEELKDFARRQIQREYDEMSRLGVKRELLDRLNDMISFTLPDGLVEAEFSQIWNRVEADRKAGRLDEEDRAKDDETLRTEYRRIAERRVRLGLLIAEIGRANAIVVGQDELTRAMRTEARRYPGQEERMMEFFRKNPSAAETLRGPIFEEKVVDFILGQARVTETVVPPEELAAEPEEKAEAAGEETGAATEFQSAEE
jgi:trigger factor